MSEPYFATGYVRLLYRTVRAQGLSSQMLLDGTSADENDFLRADFEMPFTSQMRLIENALAQAEPGLGLYAGRQLQLAAHGALGTAMQSAPDLRRGIMTFVEFLPSRASFFSLQLVEEGNSARVKIQMRGLSAPLVVFFSESIFFSLVHGLHFYTGQREAMTQLQLAYPDPGYGAQYQSLFGGPARFGCASTELIFSRALLSLPSPESDPATFAHSVKRCQDRMVQQQGNSDMVLDIVLAIGSFLQENPGKLWSVEEVAPLFAMSSRTLLRKLKERGTTYQNLRDDAFKQQALVCLSSMSVEATAISLGFADTSSFRRSFKRWFGVTPKEHQLSDYTNKSKH